MGEITKTITIEVPVDLVYQVIKEGALSGWGEKYCSDLMPGGVIVPSLAKDAPNSELIFRGEKWGGRIELTYRFRSIGESACEVTINHKYSLVFDDSAKMAMMNVLGALVMFETGFKVGRLKAIK